MHELRRCRKLFLILALAFSCDAELNRRPEADGGPRADASGPTDGAASDGAPVRDAVGSGEDGSPGDGPRVDAGPPLPDGSLPPPQPGEWTQHAHDAQRSGYTAQVVAMPWTYAWQWNGAGSDGKQQAGHLAVPRLAQPVTGGGRVYIAAADTVYALDKQTGTVAWSKGGLGALSATFAYADGDLFVGSGDGKLYRLTGGSGQVAASYDAGAALTTPPLVAGTRIYVASAAGALHAVERATMTKAWQYDGGSPAATPPALSEQQGLLVYITQDLQVHAVAAASGAGQWKSKPTARSYAAANPGAGQAQAEAGWPVIAEGHGVVLVRYRLDWDSLWASNPFPNDNPTIRAFLQANPAQQALYALRLDDGQPAFVPAVGNGGAGDGGDLPMGPQPVVRVVDGKEVAYVIWRSGLTCGGCAQAGDCNGQWCDGREDATMGEMVLDDQTVSGFQAGDLRFVQFADIQTDEMMAISMAGEVIFHSHWLVNEAHRITDRSAARGATFSQPIVTAPAPYVIWRQCHCPAANPSCNPIIYPGGSGTTSCPTNCPFDAATRYCAGGLYSYGDQRGYPAGFYEYHNDEHGGSTPYTVVSEGHVLVKTIDGAIIALESGDPEKGGTPAWPAPASRTARAAAGAAIPRIPYTAAREHLGRVITVEGTIASAVDRRPKAIYLGFQTPHDGALLVRIFARDLQRFLYDPLTLAGHRVRVTGRVSLYWPAGVDPELVVSDPAQIDFDP